MRRLSALFIFVALSTVPLQAAEPVPAALGPVRFVPPAGWPRGEANDRNTRVFYAPTGDAAQQATIVVALGRPVEGADFDFRERFDQ